MCLPRDSSGSYFDCRLIDSLPLEANDATKVTVLALGDKDNAPPGASLGGLIIGMSEQTNIIPYNVDFK